MCLEGLLLYFRELNEGARDRMARAHLLSSAVKDRPLTALTSSWLAHINFNENKFVEAISFIRLCLESLDRTNLAAACRVSLVIGDIFNYVQDRKSSLIWYSAARNFALEYGDQASIGALTYNRAALNVFSLRIQAVGGSVNPELLDFAESEVNSAINYQAIAELQSLDHLLRGARCGLLMLRESYAEAKKEIIALLSSGQVPVGYYHRMIFQADLVRCYAETGEIHLAEREAELISPTQISKLSLDDQIVVFSSLQLAGKHFLATNLTNLELPDLKLLILEQNVRISKIRALMTEFDFLPKSLRMA